VTARIFVRYRRPVLINRDLQIAAWVTESRGRYTPQSHYDTEPETRAALDLIFDDHFSRDEPGVFAPLRDTLLVSDHYLHLADLRSYLAADARLLGLYADQDAWAVRSHARAISVRTSTKPGRPY